MFDLDAMKPRLVEGPPAQRNHGLRAQPPTTCRRGHPVREAGAAVAQIDALEGHPAQKLVGRGIHQRPVHLGLIGPAALPADDPLACLFRGIGAVNVPALNIRITKRGSDSSGIGDEPRSQRRGVTYRYRRLC